MAKYSREAVIRALEENPNMSGTIKRYFEAIRDNTLPEFYREELQNKRDNYLDETPPVDVRTIITDTDNLTRYKCQGTYVVGLCLTLKGALADGVVTNGRTQKEVLQFLSSDLNFQVGDPLNQSRISSINRVLNTMLGQLS